jgi:hypothetical protein
MHTKFRSENLRERDDLEDQGVDVDEIGTSDWLLEFSFSNILYCAKSWIDSFDLRYLLAATHERSVLMQPYNTMYLYSFYLQ